MVKIGVVESSEARDVLENTIARNYLRSAFYRTGERHTLEAATKEVEAGTWQLWIALDEKNRIIGAVTTQVVDYPNKRVLNAIYGGGVKANEWVAPMRSALAKFAEVNGCDLFEMTGRKGWGRFLKKYSGNGFCHEATVYAQEVSHG